MKKRGIITAVFSVLLVSGILAGCSGGSDASEASEAPASKASSSSASSSSAASSSPSGSAAPVSSSASGAPVSDVPVSSSGGSSEPDMVRETSLSFSIPSGFYSDKLTLEIISEDPDAAIYYTTNGSVPTESSERYTEPIKLFSRTIEPNILSVQQGISPENNYRPSSVDKANVIRAAAFYPDGSRSEIVSGTYFVGIDRERKYGNVPVISLFTDMKNLFDYDSGIYVLGKACDEWKASDPNNQNLAGWQWVGNYSGTGKEWERPVTVEYFDSDGKSAFVQDMGIRIKGKASRAEAQKSFRIIAREEYGKKSVKYELIPDNLRSDGEGTVEKYKSFVLRNGGNDCNFAKIRDPFLQELAGDRRFETEQYAPCVVFIDGEYWGMYSLTEDYSDNYIENNYGADNKNVVIVKRGEIDEGEEEDIELYNEMYDLITGSDMSDAANYEKAARLLDMGSFADYCAFNLYIYNEDSIFEDNNWQMWRVRDADGATAVSDGKWRMMAYDVDYSSGIYNDGSNFNQNNIAKVIRSSDDGSGHRKPANLFRALMRNDDFKREFVNAMCDLRSINFEKNAAVKRLNEVAAVYKTLVPDTFRRFGPDWLLWDPDEYFTQKTDQLGAFISGRYTALPGLMKKAFGFGDEANLTLSVSDGGYVNINASGVPISGSFSGVYFPECPITLKAVPNGKSFVRWEAEGCAVSDANAEEITVSFSGDFTVRAIFE